MDEIEDDRNRRPKRLTSSTRIMLAEERGQRLKYLTYGRYLGRLIFVAVIFAIAMHGQSDLQFRVGASIAVAIFGFFWVLDDARQRNRLQRISRVIEISEEKTSPKYWEDSYIRYEYGLKYSFQERYLQLLQTFEPMFWTVGALIAIWYRA